MWPLSQLSLTTGALYITFDLTGQSTESYGAWKQTTSVRKSQRSTSDRQISIIQMMMLHLWSNSDGDLSSPSS